MYLFPYFFLGHLIGDYVLQNSYIAARKGKDLKVLIFHIFLVFMSQLLVIVGKGFTMEHFISVFLSIVFLSLIHFFIDMLKYLCKKSFCRTWYYYLFDQLLHVLSLIVIILLMTNLGEYQLLIPRTLAVLLSVSVFNGYFLGILTHFIISSGAYKRDYIGYALRMISPFFYIINIYAYMIYALFCLAVLIYRYSKSNLLNYIFTLILTIILLEVML